MSRGIPPIERLPLCGKEYRYAKKTLTCRRAEGHRGKHRVSREAITDEIRIRARNANN